MEQACQEGALDLIVHTHLDIVQSGHLSEQTDILEGSGNTQPVDLGCIHALGIHTVNEDRATGGLINRGQQVKDGGLTGTVGTDQTGNLGGADGDVETVDSSQTTELMHQIRRIRDTFHIAIFLIEHDMNLVMNVCETIAVVNYGRLIAKGTPDEIRENPAVIEAYLGKQED